MVRPNLDVQMYVFKTVSVKIVLMFIFTCISRMLALGLARRCQWKSCLTSPRDLTLQESFKAHVET